MKILFIITDYGSFNNFLGEIAIELLKKDHSVDVICSSVKVIDYEDKYPYENLGIKFHFLNFPRNFNLLSQIKACNAIKSCVDRIDPNVVSIHFTTAMFTVLLLGRLKVNTIGTFHGIGYPIIDGKIKKMIFKIVEHTCCRRLDQIWVLNKFDYDLLSVTYPGKINLLSTKGLGCDLSRFNIDKFTEAYKAEFKQQLGINPNDFVLTFTGRFVSFKGFSLVVNSIRYAIENLKETNLKLLLIGGKDNLHPTGLSIEQEIWSEQSENVINVGFTSSVEKYLAITDVFTFPSMREGMPVCIIEALAMGIPVITNNTRGCNDLITSGVNGIVLDSPTIEKLARAIVELKNNTTMRNHFKFTISIDREKLDRTMFVNQQLKMFENI